MRASKGVAAIRRRFTRRHFSMTDPISSRGGLPPQQPRRLSNLHGDGLVACDSRHRAVGLCRRDLVQTKKVGLPETATRLRAHRYGSPLIAVAVDPDALVSPMTTWCQLSIGRWPRISRSGRRWGIASGWGWIIPRRWRRRTVRYRATNDRARGDAAENAQAYRAAETARVCINRSKRD